MSFPQPKFRREKREKREDFEKSKSKNFIPKSDEIKPKNLKSAI